VILLALATCGRMDPESKTVTGKRVHWVVNRVDISSDLIPANGRERVGDHVRDLDVRVPGLDGHQCQVDEPVLSETKEICFISVLMCRNCSIHINCMLIDKGFIENYYVKII